MPEGVAGIWALNNGFEEDATLTAVETWADTVAALGGTAE